MSQLNPLILHRVLPPAPQVPKGLFIKDEPSLDLLGETFVPELLKMTESQDLEAAEGKGHEAGLVGGAM